MKKVILLPLLILTSCSWINMKLGLPDDNIGEELVEDVIDMKTGLDIDLTPSTPEHQSKTLSPAPLPGIPPMR